LTVFECTARDTARERTEDTMATRGAKKDTKKGAETDATRPYGSGWIGEVKGLTGYFFKVRSPRTGKRVQRFGGETKAEAQAAMMKFLADEGDARAATTPDARTGLVGISVSKLLEEYLHVAETRVSARHFAMLEAQLKNFRDSIPGGGDVAAAGVTRATVESYLAERQRTKPGASYTVEVVRKGKTVSEVRTKPLSAATQRRYLAAIGGLFAFAQDRKYVSVNPARGVKLGRGQEHEPTFLTAEQLTKLYAHVAPQVRALIVFLGETGARLGEGRALQWHEVAANFAGVTFTRTKSGRTRFVPLTARVREILEELNDARVKPLRGEDPVFEPYSKSRIERLFRDAVKSAGLPAARVHDLRHSFASQLVQAGTALSVVMQLCGHSSLTVTSRYAKHAPASLAHQAVAALEAARSGTAPVAAAAK
jgi:integrase